MKKLPLSSRIILSDFDLKSSAPVYRNTTNTGRTSIKSQQYQLYSGSIELCCFGYQSTKELTAFFQSLKGGVEPIALVLPNFKTVNPISGAPVLSVPYIANTSTVVINNFTGELSAGDYFNIQNDAKLYMILTNGSAGDVFEISPSLRTNQPSGARLSFTPQLKVRLEDDDFDVKPNKSIQSLKIEVKFTEDL